MFTFGGGGLVNYLHVLVARYTSLRLVIMLFMHVHAGCLYPRGEGRGEGEEMIPLRF